MVEKRIGRMILKNRGNNTENSGFTSNPTIFNLFSVYRVIDSVRVLV